MNEIVNKFVSAGDKFMREMHLRQPGFAYSACRPFTKNTERIQKFKETGDSRYIYQNELDKACFQHDMAYGDFKDLTRRKTSDKILHDKELNLAKNPKYDGYQRDFASMVYKLFDKKTSATRAEDKKRITINNFFQKNLKEFNREPNKIWVHKDSEFYNRLMKSCLEKNDREMYSTHNEGKSVIAERFIRTLNNKTYKYMTSISKNLYIDKLDDTVNKYNNTCHRAIKMKPVDVKPSTYIDFSREINDEDPKFKIGELVRISKYKNIFVKGYVPNCSEEVFVIKRAKNFVPWTYVISDLNGEEIVGTVCEKELEKTNQKEFKAEKVIKRKSDKLYVKWRGYDCSFNSWIDKKDIKYK